MEKVDTMCDGTFETVPSGGLSFDWKRVNGDTDGTVIVKNDRTMECNNLPGGW